MIFKSVKSVAKNYFEEIRIIREKKINPRHPRAIINDRLENHSNPNNLWQKQLAKIRAICGKKINPPKSACHYQR